MAMRIAARYVTRRLSSSGKVLSEEEKAAENVYIKKMEQEKLQKLARKGPGEATPTSGGSAGGPVADAKPATSSASGASTEKTSTDKNRNYAVLAGTITVLGAVGWYLKASKKKPEEVQD